MSSKMQRHRFYRRIAGLATIARGGVLYGGVGD